MEESRFTKHLMGGNLELYFSDVATALGELIAEELLEKGKRLEKIFSIFNPESELSRLNAKRKLPVSHHLLAVISTALEYCALSHGAYDISKGKSFLARKQNRPLPLLACTYKDIALKGNEVSLLHGDVLIDLGSIAKGYIVDQLAEWLNRHGVLQGFVNARGDIRCFGQLPQEIDIAHPRKNNSAFGFVAVKDAAIATSGDYRQFHSTYDSSHILGKQDVISASIIASAAMEADVLATCCMVLSYEERKKLLASLPHVKALLITQDLKTEKYSDFPLQKNKKGGLG